MSKKIAVFLFLLAHLSVYAQFEISTIGARSAAMGGCSVALNDFWSGVHNMASPALHTRNTIGLAYRQNYLMEGMAYKSIATALPTRHYGTWTACYTHYGNIDYNEQTASAGYAMQIGKNLFLGGAVNYLHRGTSDPHYKPLNLLTVGVGLRYHANDKLAVGFCTKNPTMTTIDAAHHIRIPTTMNLGIAYQALPQLLTTAEIDKNIYYRPTVRLGIEYRLHQTFMARIGFSSNPATYTFGVSYCHTLGTIDLAMQTHSILGISPQLSATFWL